jgi:hypothetical protein
LKLSLSDRDASVPPKDPPGLFCKRETREPVVPQVPSTSKGANISNRPQASTKKRPIAQFTNEQLTIHAHGESFSAVMEAIRLATGITMQTPGGDDSVGVFIDVGPAPMRDAIEALLDGSSYNYLILESATNPQIATGLILISKTGSASPTVTAETTASPVHVQTPAVPDLSGSEPETAEEEEPVAPVQPRAIPDSVPKGIDVRRLAQDSGRTVGQVLNDLQKQQEQDLDAAAQSEAQAAAPQQ